MAQQVTKVHHSGRRDSSTIAKFSCRGSEARAM